MNFKEQNEYILNNYRYKKASELAMAVGLKSKQSVLNRLKKMGIHSKPCTVLRPEICKDIRKLWENGFSCNEVAGVLGLGRPLVAQEINKNPVREYEYMFHTLTPLSSYILGFLYADGSVSERDETRKKQVRFCQSNEPYLKKVARAIGVREDRVRYSGRGGYVLSISSDIMVDRLIELGCVPNKTYADLKVPEEITDGLFPHFLRGYFDGDGSLSVKTDRGLLFPSVILYGGKSFTISLLNRINTLWGYVGKAGISCKKGREVSTPAGGSKATIDLWSAYYGKKRGAVGLLKKIYSNAGIYLDRKYQRFLKISHVI